VHLGFFANSVDAISMANRTTNQLAKQLALAIEEEHHSRKQYLKAIQGKLLAQKGASPRLKQKLVEQFAGYWLDAKKTRAKLEEYFETSSSR
jgi:hypothetical protein